MVVSTPCCTAGGKLVGQSAEDYPDSALFALGIGKLQRIRFRRLPRHNTTAEPDEICAIHIVPSFSSFPRCRSTYA